MTYMHHISRAVLGRVVTGVALTAVLLLSGCGEEEKLPQSVSDSSFALGTVCNVKLYGQENEQHIPAVFDLIEEIEEKMSVKKDDTEASRLNEKAGKGPVEVSEDTFHVVSRGKYYSALGDGAFDITIKPLVDLWGIGTDAARIPSETEIDEALEKVDYAKLKLDGERSTVELTEEGMGVDLGGIAKGYASDRAAALLQEKGVEYGIINFGGNVLAFGEKGGDTAWRIGIQSPVEERGSYVGIVEVRDEAVVTSGKYERYFERDGERYHHILSTEDGRPVRNSLTSVSIVSEKALEADALSTLIFVQGLEKGLNTAEELEGVEAILITGEKVIYTTSGLRERFSISDKQYARGESESILNGTGGE
jgi:thiamine biosynthesis lipoprotein